MNENSRSTSGPDLILHPVRMRIIVALAAEPMTTAELAERLPEIPPATLYRHLAILRRGGVLAVAGERRVGGATERRFRLHPGAASFGPEEIARATPEDHLRWFAGYVAGLLGSFSRYIARGEPDFVRDGVGYRHVVLNLTDEEFVEMATALGAALIPFITNQPGDGRRPRLLATILMPAE